MNIPYSLYSKGIAGETAHSRSFPGPALLLVNNYTKFIGQIQGAHPLYLLGGELIAEIKYRKHEYESQKEELKI